MDIVGQLIAALKISGRAAFTVFSACALCLLAERYQPQLFAGLPIWVMPSLRVAVIFSFVVVVLAGLYWAGDSLATFAREKAKAARRPNNIRRLRKTIASSPLAIKYVLLYSVSQASRRVSAPPDHPVTIHMVDNNLIESDYGDSHTFRITEDAWRAIISLPDFVPTNQTAMRRPFYEGADEERMKLDIPEQYH
ncbi:hypothetical protein [Paracoccus sp. SY]|uniref:hypothetical protein n=1 Tax=Paracoccus sp. SY TaxID=1330255 RepID=UPI000CD2877B|nr:hypothetical protein [Paracoccus sp. SY]